MDFRFIDVRRDTDGIVIRFRRVRRDGKGPAEVEYRLHCDDELLAAVEYAEEIVGGPHDDAPGL